MSIIIAAFTLWGLVVPRPNFTISSTNTTCAVIEGTPPPGLCGLALDNTVVTCEPPFLGLSQSTCIQEFNNSLSRPIHLPYYNCNGLFCTVNDTYIYDVCIPVSKFTCPPSTSCVNHLYYNLAIDMDPVNHTIAIPAPITTPATIRLDLTISSTNPIRFGDRAILRWTWVSNYSGVVCAGPSLQHAFDTNTRSTYSLVAGIQLLDHPITDLSFSVLGWNDTTDTLTLNQLSAETNCTQDQDNCPPPCTYYETDILNVTEVPGYGTLVTWSYTGLIEEALIGFEIHFKQPTLITGLNNIILDTPVMGQQLTWVTNDTDINRLYLASNDTVNISALVLVATVNISDCQLWKPVVESGTPVIGCDKTVNVEDSAWMSAAPFSVFSNGTTESNTRLTNVTVETWLDPAWFYAPLVTVLNVSVPQLGMIQTAVDEKMTFNLVDNPMYLDEQHRLDVLVVVPTIFRTAVNISRCLNTSLEPPPGACPASTFDLTQFGREAWMTAFPSADGSVIKWEIVFQNTGKAAILWGINDGLMSLEEDDSGTGDNISSGVIIPGVNIEKLDVNAMAWVTVNFTYPSSSSWIRGIFMPGYKVAIRPCNVDGQNCACSAPSFFHSLLQGQQYTLKNPFLRRVDVPGATLEGMFDNQGNQLMFIWSAPGTSPIGSQVVDDTNSPDRDTKYSLINTTLVMQQLGGYGGPVNITDIPWSGVSSGAICKGDDCDMFRYSWTDDLHPNTVTTRVNIANLFSYTPGNMIQNNFATMMLTPRFWVGGTCNEEDTKLYSTMHLDRCNANMNTECGTVPYTVTVGREEGGTGFLSFSFTDPTGCGGQYLPMQVLLYPTTQTYYMPIKYNLIIDTVLWIEPVDVNLLNYTYPAYLQMLYNIEPTTANVDPVLMLAINQPVALYDQTQQWLTDITQIIPAGKLFQIYVKITPSP